ncbi:MAG: cytochrome c oxidase subunit II [Gammaproteobacteria bacterium]|nr:MAG: cytochrome c oxidase subunit II [Gammaproteobacteria bacterium]
MLLRVLRYLPALLVGGLVLLVAQTAGADWGALNLPEGVTPISKKVYDLHMLILWICVVIAVIVFGAMFYSMYAHRKSRGAQPAQFHESTKVEVIWTIIPFLILVGMAIPATSTLVFMSDTENADLTIKITGHQWKWQYDYIDDGISFISSLTEESRNAIKGDPASVDNYLLDVDKPLVLPTNKKVRFLVTASDVIHSWWVPMLGQKQDAIPGFINEMWTRINEEGTYRGQCAELCGKDHGFMPVVVVAKNEADYQAWVNEQKGEAAAAAAAAEETWTQDELMAKGAKVYNTQCAACHGANGEGGIGKPIVGSAIATGPLAGHLDIIMKGKQGTAMAAYAAILNDVDIAAVTTYQRNSWGNAASPVQPADVKTAR